MTVGVDVRNAVRPFQRKAQADFLASSSSFLKTVSGKVIKFLDFSVEDVILGDIAHGLSHVCRYGGQCSRFYSVAEHSVLVSKFVEHICVTREILIPGIIVSGLLHDSPEAYLGDMTTPLKVLCPGYQLIESHFADVCQKAFGVHARFDHPIIKQCDFEMYLRERTFLMPGEGPPVDDELSSLLEVRFLTPDAAKKAFLERAEELGLSRAA